MQRDNLLKLIKQTVLAIEPTAEIILYGSRARGDAEPDSDWDLLILVDGEVDNERDDRISHKIYEVEWKHDEVLTPLVYSRKVWNTPVYQNMPLHQNINREGIRL